MITPLYLFANVDQHNHLACSRIIGFLLYLPNFEFIEKGIPTSQDDVLYNWTSTHIVVKSSDGCILRGTHKMHCHNESLHSSLL
jgi:hypothetical protein